MIFYEDRVRLTDAELAQLRERAARHGYSVGQIRTWEDYEEAVMRAYPENLPRFVEALERYLNEENSNRTN